MQPFTVAQLQNMMRTCTGEDRVFISSPEDLDVSLQALGLDSLAILELVTQIQQTYGMPFADEVIDELETPRDVLTYVNDHLASV